MTVWRDVTLMARATDVDEQDRFLGTRLQLPLQVDDAVHYEIVGRTFGALPPEEAAYLRLITVRARPNEEARLIETLRSQQPKFVDLGLVASHLGRRVIGPECEAVTVGVWPDRATIRRATGGRPERPLFEKDLADWVDRLHLETYDGIEIAPRLPAASGPPIYVIDEDLRIVDITASAAAAIGWPAEDLVGTSVLDISLADPETAGRAVGGVDPDGRSHGRGSVARARRRRRVHPLPRHARCAHRRAPRGPRPSLARTGADARRPRVGARGGIPDAGQDRSVGRHAIPGHAEAPSVAARGFGARLNR